jgi:NAD+ diphosphatase
MNEFIAINAYRPLLRMYRSFFPDPQDGVLGVIERGGEILLIKNKFGSQRWTLPGGGIEDGESPSEALFREIEEEIGARVIVKESLGYLTRPRGFRHAAYMRRGAFAFTAELGQAEIKPDPREILDARWFSPDALPEPMTDVALRVLALRKGNTDPKTN